MSIGKKNENIFFSNFPKLVLPIFSTLVEGISYFWPQIRILQAQILPGDTSRRLETGAMVQTWKTNGEQIRDFLMVKPLVF